MSWKDLHSLKGRVQGLPLVLCGPLVRYADTASVTVFVALNKPQKVTLHVYDWIGGAKKVAKIGTRTTTRLGDNLYVVAVTASEGDALKWGRRYYYNMSFGTPGTDSQGVPDTGTNLFDSNIVAKDSAAAIETLVYKRAGQPDLPGFDLPADDLNNLRILHASCRKPHGEGADALQIVDELLTKPTWSGPTQPRPQQLFLTGDQIYADDVADPLLMALTDAGEALLGWTEMLPDVDKTPEELPPGTRLDVAQDIAGFSSGHAVSHLFGLGEFFAMYLFAWSDVVWPRALPDWNDLHPDEPDEADGDFTAVRNRVLSYRQTLPKVRKALANIPFYTMFDDHEVTDDWFITKEWSKRVTREKPLGRRVVQNGLAAFAVFQAWGNTPGLFDAPTKPGAKVLASLSTLNAPATAERTTLEDLLIPVLKSGLSASWLSFTHPPGTMTWHYRYVGAKHEVLVLDPRTHREYLRGDLDPPSLITAQALNAMVPEPAVPSDGVTLVVAPAPYIGVELVEKYLQGLAKEVDKEIEHPTTRAGWILRAVGVRTVSMTDAEAWSSSPGTFEFLLARLFDKRTRVVVLSGDVHYGFCARMRYWATRPLGSATTQRRDGVLVQFTASALKNQASLTEMLHERGFMPGPIPTAVIERAGWNTAPLVRRWHIQRKMKQWPAVTDPRLTRADGYSAAPDWRYRAEFLPADISPQSTSIGIRNPAALSPFDALDSLTQFHSLFLTAKEEWAPGHEIVGVNNLGDISFTWLNTAKEVRQRLWWWKGGTLGPNHERTISMQATEPDLPPLPVFTP